MLSTTYNSTAIWLANERPLTPGKGTFTLLRNDESSLDNREARRGYSTTLRVVMEHTIRPVGPALRAFWAGFKRLTNQPVALPFWPAEATWANRAAGPYSGGLNIAFKRDWSQWEIYEGTEPTWPAAGDRWAPLLWGRFEPENSPGYASPEITDVDLKFTESSPAAWALSVAAGSWTAGPLPPAGYGSAPDVCPLSVNLWDLNQTLRVRVQRESLGFTREESTTFYLQAAVNVFDHASLPTTAAGAATLLRFFLDHADGASFWATTGVALARLSAAALTTDTVLNLEDAGALLVGDYVMLVPSAGGTPICRRVTAVSSTTLTVNSAVGTALPKGLAVWPLYLVANDSPKIEVEWANSVVATVRQTLREVPAEYTPGAGETLGTTLGRLATRVFLYELTDGDGNVSRFTSFETDLTHGGHTWDSDNWAHGDLTRSLNIERDELELTTFVSLANPLLAQSTASAETPLTVVIYSADLITGTVSNVVTFFTGEITKAGVKGSTLKATATPGGRRFDDLLPRLTKGPDCAHSLFDTGCTLLKTHWHFTGVVAAGSSSAWPYTLNVATLARTTYAAPTYFADWFALGWVEWTPPTGPVQRRPIIASTNPVSGALTLTLKRWWDGTPINGDALVLYPGCDLQLATCRAYQASNNPRGKFDNGDNFGGDPFIPAGDPALIKNSNSGSGGKKG